MSTSTYSTSDLSRRSGDIIAEALRHPVTITQRNKPRLVLCRSRITTGSATAPTQGPPVRSRVCPATFSPRSKRLFWPTRGRKTNREL